ncbi:licodione synthase-like [Vicia villosa]|uniref:licodione synthase-like n=1 Tax=Vicia villosa TaxID=3911 RepID=UPI00273AC374|nr:licodione synthase-like [Vicia villosa]
MENFLLAFTIFLSSFIYYMIFRPLLNRRKKLPPSPLFKLPIIGHMHMLSPILHKSFDNLFHKYGPLFSLNLGSVLVVVASTPHFAKQILQINEHAFHNRDHSAAIKRLTYESSLAFAPYGDYWRFIKKLAMSELLGARSVNNFKYLRLRETHSLLKFFANKAKSYETVNVAQELLKLSNNIISKMMLGEAEEARDVVRDVTQIFGEFNASDFIWLLKKLDLQEFGKRIEDLFVRFDTLVESIISKREEVRKNKERVKNKNEEGVEFKDFLDILLDCAEDVNCEVKIERIHLKGLVMDFFSAGIDTTAIATEWVLAELMNNPSLLQKAREEIDKVVGKTRLVDESDCINLPYLNAIMKETFRLHPPVPMIARRCVTTCNIENYVIPENSLVIVNNWSMGRNPEYWEKPLEFNPERFLGKSNEGVDVKGQNFQILPFGSGRRMCPSVGYAMQALPALFGAIIQCFDFHVVGCNGEIMKGDDIVIDGNERPGLTAPRANDLVCVPVERVECRGLLQNLGC